MYITGAVEILLNYISPEIALFGDFEADKDILYHNIRVYGTIFLIIIGILVFIGVKFVSKFAPVALICVLISILSIYLGIFINYNGKSTIAKNGTLITEFFFLNFFLFWQASTSTKFAPLAVAYCQIRTTSPALLKAWRSFSATSMAQWVV